MRVIGTAGHVDHGKSTLVRALTGIEPDRLKEEKLRGMTLDLGFAWMDLPLPTGYVESIGIVDVPGHIDFIKNMLAGVGGIDAAVLVIAADEGVMPQTREHLAILDVLGVPSLVVALAKVDLVDDAEWLDLVELDIGELLQTTQFAASPVVRVSALTGAGLDDLTTALARQLEQLAPRRNRARPRLPIDRIFSLSGFGTVVTGTLSDGPLALGDVVTVLPRGLAARIRGMQSHKQTIGRADPGSRVALNLTGVGTDDLRRGDVVALLNTLQPTVLVDVAFRLLPDAPKPLTHNMAVDFFTGASETPARARVLGAEQIDPGATGWLQLRLEKPIVAAAGDRYLLRMPSPSVTLGGGMVLSPHPRRRWRRFDPSVIERLRTLAQGSPDEILLQTLARHPFVSAKALVGLSGLDLTVAGEALAELAADHSIFSLETGTEPVLATLESWQQVRRRLVDAVDAYHRQVPLRRGMARGELRSKLQDTALSGSSGLRLFNSWLDAAARAGDIQIDESLVWRAGFAPQVSAQQQARVDRVLARLAASGYSPPSAEEVTDLLGGDQPLVEMLVEQGRLVRVGPGLLYRQEEFATMVEQVRGYIQTQGAITLAEARDLFATSRKYAQAFLEELDARRITRRDGDRRLLR
jgi:selenocysteine-specific elongation factor